MFRWLQNNQEIQHAAQEIWFRDTLRTTRAYGREAELEQMTRYCDKEGSITPLIVSGGTGSGKTSLLMKFVEHYTDRYVEACRARHRQVRWSLSSTTQTVAYRWCCNTSRVISGEEGQYVSFIVGGNWWFGVFFGEDGCLERRVVVYENS